MRFLAGEGLAAISPIAAATSAAILLAMVTHSGVASALDPFEIQVYDGTANAPGVFGLELHLNRVASGQRDAIAPELPLNRQTHMTLEPSVGITPFWELGSYFQSALRADGTFDYAGVKVRSKFVTPPSWDAHVRLGANLELSLLPETYDRNRWGGELRPMIAWENAHWLFAINPILDFSFAGDAARDAPQFEPAAAVMRKFEDQLAVGVEYYGALGPINQPLSANEQEHFIYEVVELLAIRNLELNAGIGEGLTSASKGAVFKLIVGYQWDITGDAARTVARNSLTGKPPAPLR